MSALWCSDNGWHIRKHFPYFITIQNKGIQITPFQCLSVVVAFCYNGSLWKLLFCWGVVPNIIKIVALAQWFPKWQSGRPGGIARHGGVARCLMLCATSKVNWGPQSLVLLFWGSQAEKFGNHCFSWLCLLSSSGEAQWLELINPSQDKFEPFWFEVTYLKRFFWFYSSCGKKNILHIKTKTEHLQMLCNKLMSCIGIALEKQNKYHDQNVP